MTLAGRVKPFEAPLECARVGQPRNQRFRVGVVADQSKRLEVIDQVGPRLSPQDVQGPMPQDRKNPASRFAACGIEAGRILPDADEAIVQRLFGEITTAKEANCDAEHLRR